MNKKQITKQTKNNSKERKSVIQVPAEPGIRNSIVIPHWQKLAKQFMEQSWRE